MQVAICASPPLTPRRREAPAVICEWRLRVAECLRDRHLDPRRQVDKRPAPALGKPLCRTHAKLQAMASGREGFAEFAGAGATATAGQPTSTARHAHVARYGRLARAPVDDEVMTLRLARDGLVNGAAKHGLIGAGAQGRTQIGRIVLAEAHVERARAGEPHAITTLTEVVRHRRDETEATAGLLDAHVARGTTGAERNVLERPLLH